MNGVPLVIHQVVFCAGNRQEQTERDDFRDPLRIFEIAINGFFLYCFRKVLQYLVKLHFSIDCV